MIGRVILAALLAGIAAGFIMGAIQYVRLTPLILAAEKYETAEAGSCVENMPGMTMCPEGTASWMPSPGFERSFYTTLASAMTGAGFAALMAGVSLLTGLALNRRNGLVWGLCGFLAATLAPAAGLPPELPGMPVADLADRQLWWVLTILATAGGLYLIAARREIRAAVAAVVLIALPHVAGAPEAATHETQVPAGLAAAFASNAIAAGAVFWALLGLFLGLALERFVKELSAS